MIHMLRRDPELRAGHHTDQIVEEIVMGERDSPEETIDMAETQKTANPMLMEMGTSVGRERTCQ
jgi:hypothetical protein